jgi:hypothetical protein
MSTQVYGNKLDNWQIQPKPNPVTRKSVDKLLTSSVWGQFCGGGYAFTLTENDVKYITAETYDRYKLISRNSGIRTFVANYIDRSSVTLTFGTDITYFDQLVPVDKQCFVHDSTLEHLREQLNSGTITAYEWLVGFHDANKVLIDNLSSINFQFNTIDPKATYSEINQNIHFLFDNIAIAKQQAYSNYIVYTLSVPNLGLDAYLRAYRAGQFSIDQMNNIALSLEKSAEAQGYFPKTYQGGFSPIGLSATVPVECSGRVGWPNKQ